jgi:hypothetical protein
MSRMAEGPIGKRPVSQQIRTAAFFKHQHAHPAEAVVHNRMNRFPLASP